MKFTLDPAIEQDWQDFSRSLRRRGRSPSTEGIYQKSFITFWKWAESVGLPPDSAKVDYRVLNRWADDLQTAPAVRNGQTIQGTDPESGERLLLVRSPATRRILFVNLRPFFSWYAKEYETTNPFDRADRAGDPRPVPVPTVPIEDLRKLLATCATKDFRARRDNALIRILVDTGCRLGELVSLTCDSWNRDADLLTLDGKTGIRIVPLAASTAEALGRYLRERKTHRLAALGALWVSKQGALTPSGIAQVLRSRCADAGIDHINPHRLRHNFAHEFRVGGGSEGDLMYLAGWSSPTMAHRYGRSAAMSRAQDAARRIGLGDKL